MKHLFVILVAGLLALSPRAVAAGVTEGGGTGILDVDTPETLPAGRISLSLAPRYGYLDASLTRLHTFVGHAGLTLGLSSGLEASAVLPLHAFFRTDTNAGAGAIFEEDFSFRTRDLELKLRKAFPLGGERLRFAVQGIGTAPIGSDRVESIYAPGDSVKPFTADEWNYGVMVLASLDLTGPTGNAPIRLHLNSGYYLNRNETDYRYRSAFRYPLPISPPTESKENDLFLLGAGLEFPLGRLSAFGELTTEQLVNQRDQLRFSENPITASAGLRFLFPGGVGLTTGLSINMSGDDEDTAFDPSDLYPDWEARVALSFGDILQSRRQRLAQKNKDAPKTDPVIQTVASTGEAGDVDTVSAAAEAPVAEVPVAEAPVAEVPVAEVPVAEVPVAEVPVAEVPVAEVPVAEVPVAEVPVAEVPVAETAAVSPKGDEPLPSPLPVNEPDTVKTTPEAGPGPTKPAPVPANTPEQDGDWDGDGVLDTEDRCPRRAEDWDGFRDTDGCPDLDNDQDGILDVDDLCPNSPEDFLAPNPNDGCPTPFRKSMNSDAGEGEGKEPMTALRSRSTDNRDLTPEPLAAGQTRAPVGETPATVQTASSSFIDTDGDMIPDDRDRCPLMKEDPDGWEDSDGCPDLDNDGDGIPDTADRCPNAPETWNGFQDEDGCPDIQPAAEDPAARSRSEDLAREQLRVTRQLSDIVLAMQTVNTPPDENPLNPQADWDDDGVGDLHDRCPEIKEDVDGWEDEDGCPDLDNDGDGILDGLDRCPNAAETWNGFEDEDGCPDRRPASPPQASVPNPPVVINVAEPRAPATPEAAPKTTPIPAIPRTPSRPELLLTVYFPSGGAVLGNFAQGSLDELVQELHQYPGQTLEVAGYSDSQGSETVNLELSRQRARRVMDFLVSSGIAAQRLRLAARGETDPIADNALQEGRARNRRVEIRLLPDGNGDRP